MLIMNEHIKNIILSDEKLKQIFSSIMEKDLHYWKKFGSPDDIYKWLNNFLNKNEVYLALILADNILYYNIDEVRYLWRLILTNRVKRGLFDKIFGDTYLGKAEETRRQFTAFIKNKCVFVGFGEMHKSGPHMIYPFQQAVSNVIEKKDICFIEYSKFLSSKIALSKKQVIFLLDDFIGTGNQAVKEWKTRIMVSDNYRRNKHIKFFYLALTGFQAGVIIPLQSFH